MFEHSYRQINSKWSRCFSQYVNITFAEMKLMKENGESEAQSQLDTFHKCISGLVEPVSERYVFHYTTVDALFNGILRGRKDETDSDICLWASNALYMNDPREIRTGYEFMQKLISDYFIKLEDESDVDNLKDIISTYFLSSFSLLRDALPMWRMYAKNATGVALCFDLDRMRESSSGEFRRCVYLTDDVEKRIRECLRGITAVNVSSGALLVIFLTVLIGICKSKNPEEIAEVIHPYLRLVSALKHKAYIDEDEVRLVLVAGESDRKFRLKDNKFIPYVEQYFPKEVLTEIIVGPNNDMLRTVYSLETYLKQIGFDHVKVTASDIPYND